MKFLKNNKGSYLYINKKRIVETIKTVVLFSFAVGLYLIGYITLKTNKSLWTIFAVLSVLPAAKSAVSMIMFFRFSSISDDEYSLIESCRGKVLTNYEYVFTTSEKSYYVKAVSCIDSTVILLFNKDKLNASNELKDHINMAIEREGYKGYSIKIFTDIKDYTNRLKEMNDKLSEDSNYSAERIFALFNAITL
ncbi:MAG: hypothetical protein Q4D29_07120 [Lachnospiraceae bacterium]|nr:hypothetical protein [Lachnospiraceae bacterium]